MTRRDTVVITGIGLETPGDTPLGPLLEALAPVAGRDGPGAEGRPARRGHRYKDEATKLALAAAQRALADAGLPTDPGAQLRPESFGVVASSNLGNVATVLRALDAIRARGVDAASPMDLPNASSNNVAATLAIWFGLRALNLMVCNGPTGGTDAVRLAATAIRAGRADRMLVLGVERPDEAAQRLVAGSCDAAGNPGGPVAAIAAAVVVEAAEAARARGKAAYAEVEAVATSALEALLKDLDGLLSPEGPAVDLWMLPGRRPAGQDASPATIAGRLGPLRGALREDPADVIGETYGAHGVVQAVAAAAWLRARPADCRVLATSGGVLGDRALASVLYRWPCGRQAPRGQRRAQALARRQDLAQAHWQVESRSCYGHRLTLRRPARPPGGPARPSVLCIHGMGMGADVWSRLREELETDFHPAFLTMPWDGGQGSLWGRAARPEAWIEAGLAMLPSSPDLVIAHSFGANALLEYLATPRTEGPRAVALVSPFFKAHPDAVDWGVLSHHVNRFLELLREGLRANDGHVGLAPDIEAGIAAKVRDRIGVYGWCEFLRLLLRTPFLDLGAITRPVLVLGGARDIASDWPDCERLAAALPNARAALSPASGHFCMVEDAAWFARSIREFAAGAWRAPTPFPLST